MLNVGGRLACIPCYDVARSVECVTEIWLLEECREKNQVLVKEKICFQEMPFEKISGGRNWGVSPMGE
ncbi:OLC1v1025542C1, partial [Oldenlandia corymbosa var. corymbosa]